MNRSFGRLAFAALLSMVSYPTTAQPHDSLQVLIVHSYDRSTEPYSLATETFRIHMQRLHPDPISFREVNLEARHDDSGQRELMVVKLLGNLFTGREPDLIVAVGPPAISFWLRQRDVIFPSAPLVAVAGDERFSRSDLRPGDYGIVTPVPFVAFVDDLLSLVPDISHVLTIFGATPYERRLAAYARFQWAAFGERVSFEFTNDLTLPELLTRVSQLGEHSAILYGLFNSDPAGVALQHGSALPMVREVSNVPVFGTLENQLGKGIVGGRLLQLQRIGEEMAGATSQLLQEKPAEPGWQHIALSAPTYDWRELQAAGIDLGRLPADSVIRFKPAPLWHRYWHWIAPAVLLIISQSLLITSLLLERWRRRRAESARASLSGRLISAYEEERCRISRELHDDLSQRLARLAIDAGTIAAREDQGPQPQAWRQFYQDLVGVSKDCHDLSYRLHPSLLEDLGISTALRSECQSISKHTSANVLEDIVEVSGKLPREAALCAYRIAQEALSNAVRHAQASTIVLSLWQEAETLMLRVEDDGKGFRYQDNRLDTGLGLSSMRERASLIGAKLTVSSAIGRGTTVTLSIPVLPADGETR